MAKRNFYWYPVGVIIYWILILIWILFVLCFFSPPGGLLGSLNAAISNQLTPKYLTVFMNSFALVGAYVVTRLLLSFRISWKNVTLEAGCVFAVFWVGLTTMALLSARCDIYIFCADDGSSSQSECEIDWDRQGGYCR